MLEKLFEQIELICPRCRRAGAEGILLSPLQLDQIYKKEGGSVLEGFLVCENSHCDSSYPILEGVPVILKDIKGWWDYEKSKLSYVKSDAPEIQDYFKTLDSSGFISHAQRSSLSSYLDSHYGAVGRAADQSNSLVDSRLFWDTAVAMARPQSEIKYPRSLDLGCSVGRHTFELARFSDLAIGLDLNFNAVSSASLFHRGKKVHFETRKHGRCFDAVETSYSVPENALFLVADALDPPFRAEAFDLVAGLNLLDNVRLPLVLIGQMDALLGRGGFLILGSPYEWRADICRPEEWLENKEVDAPAMVRQILEADMFPKMGLKYEVLREELNVPWALRHHDRYWSLFLVHLIKARKIANAN